MITFSGTSYLGLDRHPDFIRLLAEGVQRYGTHYGGSRRSPLAPTIYSEVEHAIAEWTGAPAALLLSSGTSAGQLLSRYLSEQSFSLQSSPLSHPAMQWPGGKVHATWQSWAEQLKSVENACLSDSVDPLRTTQTAWPFPSDTAEHQAMLVVDDSHLIGHFGALGAGSWRSLSANWVGPLLLTASLGKALCLPAGVLLGEQATIDHIRDLPQFGGASPPSPAYLYAWLQAKELLQNQRQILRNHLDHLRKVIGQDQRFRSLANFPVIALLEHSWVERLYEKGITLSSFRYPTATDELYSRIVLSASHSQTELAYLEKCLKELMQEK